MGIGTNWAGNCTYRAARLHRPESVEAVQRIVTGAEKVKALGTRHSFNEIADCVADMISLEHLDRVIEIDRDRRTVTVEAGIRYGTLGEILNREGFALPNLASLPHISVAGACATATHGSGDANGNLATSVSALEMVIADGTVVSLSRESDGERFAGAVVGLGALGVVTKLTLDQLPTFEICQDVYENLPLAEVEAHLDEITSSGYSVSLFTDWREARFTQAWRKRRVTPGEPADPAAPTFFGATRSEHDLHPIAGISAENCSPQRGVPGPWHERLPHFRMEFTPSSGEELQTEYLVPRPHAVDALRAVNNLRARIAPLIRVSEIRTVAADDLWMSPCYRRACVCIHFTWVKDWNAVGEVLPRIEAALAPFDARPHWGKLFTMPGTRVRSLYEKLPNFLELARGYDPKGKFRNAFLAASIGPA